MTLVKTLVIFIEGQTEQHYEEVEIEVIDEEGVMLGDGEQKEGTANTKGTKRATFLSAEKEEEGVNESTSSNDEDRTKETRQIHEETKTDEETKVLEKTSAHDDPKTKEDPKSPNEQEELKKQPQSKKKKSKESKNNVNTDSGRC
eukprot:TRINITY_DN14629_c0_g1_i1.p1 TRINITY_DN14629_c0_g1~~TRINITY_DN14629_c0_g1_i1.p1  ORF type:complete len:145 (+),score=39.28 TRINITY_DN14629_c0_g1_i1:588-1022(+)